MSPNTVRLIGIAAILWNLAGVASYLAHVGVFGEASRPQGDVEMPPLVTAVFAIAVFSGVIGSIGLVMMKSRAMPVLWMSFAATVIDWGWVLLYNGAASAPLGVMVLVISLVLALIAGRAPLTR